MECSTASSHPQATPLARLPLSLVRSIFGFAVDKSDASAATNRMSLAQVCREWYEYVWDLESANTLRSFSIDLVMMARALSSSHELLTLRDALTLRRAHLRDLHIEPREATLLSTDVLSTLFAAMSQLETLHIRSPKASHAIFPIVQVLRAAVQHCPIVRSLTLPTQLTFDGAGATELLRTLLDSLARWKQCSGGLRALVASMQYIGIQFAAYKATRLVEALATNCPHLTMIGHCEIPLYLQHAWGYGQWHIGLDTWETFCASCTQLTAFNWVVVPFTTAFFDVFGKHVKPKLTSLALSTPSHWDREAYRRHYPEATSAGYGAIARNAHALLAACPALRHLRVMYPVHDAPSVATSDLYGDTFCEALATCCPLLERFELEPASDATLVAFTDRAMRALARLPRLTDVTLAVVNITGGGLLALFVGSTHRRAWRRQRNYSISVGNDSARAHAQQFYPVAVQFLTRLTEWEDPHDDDDAAEGVVPCSLPGASERVLLQLENTVDSQAPEVSLAYLATLEELTTKVLDRHPQLRLRVVLEELSFDKYGDVVDCSAIEVLVLYTQSTVLPADATWTDESNRVLRNVFVVRGNEDNPAMYGVNDGNDDSGGDDSYDDPNSDDDSNSSTRGDPADSDNDDINSHDCSDHSSDNDDIDDMDSDAESDRELL